MPTERQMPRYQYQCHKQVWALKIARIDIFKLGLLGVGGCAVIYPVDEGYAAIDVTMDYIRRYDPQVGGYYVVYEGNYKSYLSAEAFEAGCTRL